MLKQDIKEFLTAASVVAVGCAVAFGLVFSILGSSPAKFGDAGTPFIYYSPTMATSSVGIYSSSLVLAASSGRQFASFCNASNSAPTTNDVVYLMLDATTTKPNGISIKPSSCYEMQRDNLFVGNVYAIASGSTSTLLTVYK